MTIEKLSNLCDIVIGRTPSRPESTYWGKGHKWVSISDLSSKIVETTKEEITDLAVDQIRCRMIPKGSLLLSFKLTIGKMAFAGCDLYTNEAIAGLIIKNAKVLNSDYLFYALQVAHFQGYNQAAKGKTLNSTSLAQIDIPLPPIDDQTRIAHLLGKVEELVAQRKQHLQQMDAFIKSVFLTMFGDPITNAKGYSVRRLSEFYISPKDGTKCGPFGSALKKSELVDSGVPVWNMDNIDLSGRMAHPFRMWITKEKHQELLAYSVIDGDILISRAGTVGKMCVAQMNGEPAIISTNLIRLRLSPGLLPFFFVSLMTHCKGRVGRLKTGPDGAFTHMNTGVLDNLAFPYPPPDLQRDFVAIATKVARLKSLYQNNLDDIEKLYGALSQKAFKGELDLSRIPLTGSDSELSNTTPAIQSTETGNTAKGNETNFSLEQTTVDQTTTLTVPLSKDPSRLSPTSFFTARQVADEPLIARTIATKPKHGHGADTSSPDAHIDGIIESFLLAHQGETLTADQLWDLLQHSDLGNEPQLFAKFRKWVMATLEKGKWLEQVYADVDGKHGTTKEKKVALRILNDSERA